MRPLILTSIIIIIIASILTIVGAGLKPAPTAMAMNEEKEGQELIGKKAPDWNHKIWINSKPMSLKDLKGKVVLIRWWTDTCSLCERSSPALNEFHAKYSDKGLVVIGMYHPKPFPKEKKVEAVKKALQHLGFMFPVALDNDWTTLKKFWLNRPNRGYTSVSFLIDKKGMIHHIHPGGEYHEDGKGSHEQCRIDYLEMKNMIEKLIEETD